MNFVYMPPNEEYSLDGGVIICVLRGNIVTFVQSKPQHGVSLAVGKSLSIENGLLRTGGKSCLLFAGKDEKYNKRYFDDISGMEVTWSEYDDNMYRTVPQIHIGDYRANLL